MGVQTQTLSITSAKHNRFLKSCLQPLLRPKQSCKQRRVHSNMLRLKRGVPLILQSLKHTKVPGHPMAATRTRSALRLGWTLQNGRMVWTKLVSLQDFSERCEGTYMHHCCWTTSSDVMRKEYISFFGV